MNKITVHNLSKLPVAPLSKFKELQGDFKTASSDQIDKLKKAIQERGFKYPFFAWKDKAGQKWIIDAHRRKQALEELEQDGYEIPPVPYILITAKSKKEAVEEIAYLNSRYGEINPETSLFDDNIYWFCYYNKGKKERKTDTLKALIKLQDFTDKYKNIAISGYNYENFVVEGQTKTPFTINTHVYSGMLINNEIPYRWRMKYNEDVDLCLQVLHNKWCTVSFNIWSIKKVSTTQKLKGGNQDELYQNNAYEKKILKSKSLEAVWPQYVKTVFRFGRPHHQVSWKKYFKHTLIRTDE